MHIDIAMQSSSNCIKPHHKSYFLPTKHAKRYCGFVCIYKWKLSFPVCMVLSSVKGRNWQQGKAAWQGGRSVCRGWLEVLNTSLVGRMSPAQSEREPHSLSDLRVSQHLPLSVTDVHQSIIHLHVFYSWCYIVIKLIYSCGHNSDDFPYTECS